jgi:hypothetical protein
MSTIDPTVKGYEQTIRDLLGNSIPWHVHWNTENWLVIRTSLPWVCSSHINNERLTLEDYSKGRRPPSEPKYTDNDHILIFPQDTNGICPLAWVEAAWPFIAKFRSGLTMYPEQAALYSNITLIGHPDVDPHIDAEYVDAIRETSWRKIERVWCRNSKQLREILQSRINDNVFFRDKDEGDIA